MSTSMWESLQSMMTPKQREQAARISDALLKDPTSLDNRRPLEGEENENGKAK